MDTIRIEILEKYFEAGFSILPVNSIKKPTLEWKERQTNAVKPNGEFKDINVTGVAFVCGRVSGGLEIVDFDTKNDLTGTLMSDYRKMLNDELLLRRLVIQRSISGGFHFIYKCEEIEGNKKLAKRETTVDERIKKPKEKVVGVIETRGEGGYFLVEPSTGYKIIQGDIFNVPIITIEERERLHDCAKCFNSFIPNEIDYKQRTFIKNDGDSPFEKFNNEFDVLKLLTDEGWTIVKSFPDKVHLRRPEKTEGISATYFLDSKIFYPFTTTSEFESEKGHNPVKVFSILKCNNDYSIASHKIREMGYGELYKNQVPKQADVKSPIIEKLDDVWGWDGVSEYMKKLHDGTFEMGLPLGMNRWDRYFRIKRGNLNVINGHDNVGKSVVLTFIMLITAKRYDWKWVVYMAENSKKFFMRKCVEFMTGERIRGMEMAKIGFWEQWVKEHFFVIDSSVYESYDKMLSYCEHQRAKHKIDGFLIDPYNSLKPNYGSESAKASMHQFDYEVMNTLRSYTKSNDCCVYLNCHAVSSALRKVDKDGYLIAPNRADTEGGMKFASKADDFLTVHRLTNHPADWMITDVHVRKIREQETGGMPTPKDSPLKLQMLAGGIGFTDEYGFNPLTEKMHDPIEINNQEKEKYNEFSGGVNADKFIEPAKEESENFPF